MLFFGLIALIKANYKVGIPITEDEYGNLFKVVEQVDKQNGKFWIVLSQKNESDSWELFLKLNRL